MRAQFEVLIFRVISVKYCLISQNGQVIQNWRSVSRTEIRTIDLVAMEITVDHQDGNHEVQRPTDWPVQVYNNPLHFVHAIRIHEGNECADQLAEVAITKGDPFLLPKPHSYLKSEVKSAALSIRQDNWDNEETGLSTHDIVPRVSNKPVGWNREEIMFVTGHGPFPSYLHRFNLRTHDNCSCGEKGDPIHYATKCPFTLSWHFQTPTVPLKL
ncbi:hypothetical protein AVEN_88064-1 [Araneus ventricosus]|uniref:RNase H type-1 domain-containing protein n=1 Tax=Araneus ventricosus TaxID=182803 RepID=A0A4Y2NQR2_ARAVE|nr:hypothetical protein AVEN_88064-1 [Araneus ventricosus]